MLRRTLLSIALIAGLFNLAGCPAADNSMEVRVANASTPTGADGVLLTIENVSFLRAPDAGSTDDDWFVLPMGIGVDLLAIRDIPDQFLGTIYLAPGIYTKIRFSVKKAEITVGEEKINVNIPSSELVLDFATPLTVVESINYGVLLRFDAATNVSTSDGGTTWDLADPLVVTLEQLYTITEEGKRDDVN